MILKPTTCGLYACGLKSCGWFAAPSPTPPPGALRLGWKATAVRRGPSAAYSLAARVATIKPGS